MADSETAKEASASHDQPKDDNTAEQVSEAGSPSKKSEERAVQDTSTSHEEESPQKEDGEVEDQDEDQDDHDQDQAAHNQADYKWCKIFYEPTDPSMQNYYYMHFDTRKSRYEEPTEPYWIWDALTNNVHASGLQQPSTTAAPDTASNVPAPQPTEPEQEYKGYNPAIHGSYDPTAPYAQFHNQKRLEEDGLQATTTLTTDQAAAADYTAVGTFNRFTGGFQSADKSAERHDDYNKSGRQMNAFFDVDAAANSHEGRSLKEERRQNKLSQKEIRELSKKRREKKEKKRLDFYKS